MEVKVENLRRTFGKLVAVDNLSFSFNSGDICGFVGPNGSGKTTTINIMAAIDSPDSGDVLYDGISAVDYPEKISRIIGYMPDHLPAIKSITVWEYLDFFGRCYGLKADARSKRISYLEEFTGLGSMRNKQLHSLSKGMKQRVCLARALIHNPEIMIMDEPAAGLDPQARIELRGMIKTLAAEGKGIFLSSHILSDLDEICDSAVIIEKGCLLSFGPVSQMAEKQSNTAKFEVKFSGSPETIIAVVSGAEGVASVKQTATNTIIIETSVTNGDFATTMLQKLIGAGCKVTSFNQLETSLEDIFMNITTGEVQ